MPQKAVGDTEVWLTPREASPIAKVAPQTLSNWRALHVGPPYRKLGPGRNAPVRYNKACLLDWIDDSSSAVAAR
jgi:hypothetical protein